MSETTPLIHSAENNAPNLSPLSGVTQAIEDYSPQTIDFAKWIKTKTDSLERLHDKVWREQFLIASLIYLMVEGKQILSLNPRTNGWVPMDLPRRTDSPVYAYNQVGFFVNAIKARFAQSHPKIEWYPAKDTDEAAGAAKGARVVTDHYFRKYLTEQFLQGEATLAVAGNYARLIYYSDDTRGGYGKREVTGTTEIAGESAYLCADCGRTGSTDEISGSMQGPAASPIAVPQPDGSGIVSAQPDIASDVSLSLASSGQTAAPPMQDMGGAPLPPAPAVCPGCGSPNVVTTEAPPVEAETVVGEEQYEVGDVVIESVPFFELRWDIATTLEESTWLRRKRRLRVDVLEATFPGLKIKTKGTDDTGLQQAENLRTSTYGSGGRRNQQSRAEEGDFCDFTQWWLSRPLLANVVVESDVETISGVVIPAGTKLSDMFPDGMYIADIDGLPGPVDVRNECHADMWVSGQFRQRAMTGLGIGIEDIIEPQRQLNLLLSLIYTSLRTVSNPATAFDERVFGNNVTQYLGRPDVNIPFNTTNMPENYDIRQGLFRMQGMPPSSQHYQSVQLMQQQMERASGVTNTSLGQSLGLDNRTATGAQIASANADTMTIPYLCLKAEVDRRTAVKVVKCFRKHCIDSRYLQIAGKRGEVTGMWLKAADLSDDLIAEVVPESYVPKTDFDRQQAFQQLMLMCGGPQGIQLLMKESPELFNQLTTSLGIDMGGDDYGDAVQLGRMRIEQMKANLPMVTQTIMMMPPTQVSLDPMTGQPVEVPIDPAQEGGQMLAMSVQPPVDPFELGHEASIHYLRDFLSTDEGINADPMLRAAVGVMITQHIEALATEAMIRGSIQGVAAGPMGGMGGGEDQQVGGNGGSAPKDNQQKRMESAKGGIDSVKGNAGQNPSSHRKQPRPQREAGAFGH